VLALAGRRKVFCIGQGKTGTTSAGAALEALGFAMGDQAVGELLIDDWAARDFSRILDLCQTADAFQDIPFCLPYTYVVLDQAFPGSRFILTVRDSGAQWYESLTRFHTKLIGKGRLPTADDLKTYPYRYEGWMWRAHALIHGCDEKSLYDREKTIRSYERYCTNVREYFRYRPSDLLVLNVAKPGAMGSLCQFLGVDRRGLQMPHLNSSQDGYGEPMAKAG
jgi:hypothetical protein